MLPNEIRSKLVEMRELLSDPSRWCKDSYANDKRGEMTSALAPDACSWCLKGAIMKVGITNNPGYMEVYRCIESHIPLELGACLLAKFNDSPNTKHEDVLKVLDKAIESVGAQNV